MASVFRNPAAIYGAAIGLRVVLLFYGAWQDAHSAVKYTDIDYMVFTDASRYVSRGESPYSRDTYRYTPLLAWMLLPTTWAIPGFFSFGKALFALSDVVAGWLVAKSLVLTHRMTPERALKYASFWLLNPMVANISTRGSSEGLLGVLVIALLWAVLNRRTYLAGILLGLGVHFKIYPFIYGVSTLIASQIISFITPCRIRLTLTSLLTFAALNAVMYLRYGTPFLQHTYFHHLTRIDHRHNFSPYSTLLYLTAAADPTSGHGSPTGSFESLAFIPQLPLAVVLIPLILGKKDLPGTMLAQTFAFVTFNKVCTSQYFLWYLIFLPFYLPTSSLLQKPQLGAFAATLWVVGQALWLQQGYLLEFLGMSSFVPGLFLASLGFFAVNAWILGIIVEDVGGGTRSV
ncbi:hypothetical protein ASPSYDRAFT_1173439 [Aspergillus sydowii CBS 593.65]|uniref:GPI mannosyltransferase 1 n=1 Tax=Aspergillus sydowii CBS 593.65 TaxID=1036612 RepID=A0A1L9TQ93_9EURO|nr:uncharacterized protein ASPSYDRAFT_1173439 [Aspergillus sydowii CBS 593.65]OJJ61590.1 hypothetical protein ASPSYDRAFT_1173439 [Aspergillus sydowii CBS 593.65]